MSRPGALMLAALLGSMPALASTEEEKHLILDQNALDFSTVWLNVAEPEVYVVQPPETRTEALSEWRPAILARAPETAPLFARLDRHTDRSFIGFWVGVVGMAVSLYYYDQHAPRTVGNVLWGGGWLGWLGYGALTTAELDDIGKVIAKTARKATP